jgi:hypothetical protein
MNDRAQNRGARRWHRLLPLVILAVGCGGGPSDADPFLGSWTYSQGTATDNCPSNFGGSHTSELAGRIFTIIGGTHPDQIVLVDDTPCAFSFIVSGRSATLTPTQTCDPPHDTVANASIEYSAGTLMLDGSSLQASDSGTSHNGFGATHFDCPFSESGVATKAKK